MDLYIKVAVSVFLILMFSGIGNFTKAQDSPLPDTVTHAFLPALGYNTDLGLMGGGLFNRYHYKDNTGPFYSFFSADALASTKGLLTAKVFYDKPTAMNSLMRLTSSVYVSRFLQNQFYGIGNYSKIEDEPQGFPDYYLFKSFSAGFEVALRRPLIRFIDNSQLDILGFMVFDYESPFGNGDDRLIKIHQPLGYGGARTSALGLGIVWESRDSEFAPTRGAFAKSTVEIGQSWLASSYDYFSLKTEVRAYQSFYLLREVTFANRIAFHHTSGEVAYWKLAELGGEDTMRGYPENRFLDNNVLFLNTELRTWLFNFPESDFRLGGILFMDVGRTFPNGASANTFFEDLKYTYGFGGLTSIFTDEFILRIDVGFSDEGYGIYFTAGFMF